MKSRSNENAFQMFDEEYTKKKSFTTSKKISHHFDTYHSRCHIVACSWMYDVIFSPTLERLSIYSINK